MAMTTNNSINSGVLDTSVPLRLSAAQVRLILPGLAHLIHAHAYWAVYGQTTERDPELRWPRPGYDGGHYDARAMAFLSEAHRALRRLGPRGGRLRLHHFQIAGLAFAARVTAKRLRHGHLAPWRSDWRAASARLLRRLEVLAKRSRRTYLKVRGQQAYDDLHVCWLRHLRWARTSLLFCGCGKPPCGGMRKYYQRVVSRCADGLRSGLIQRNCCPPADPQLRRLARRALAAIRRGRAPSLSLRALLQNAPQADADLTSFVLKRRWLSPWPEMNN